ncbi:hypothetical protein GGR54DRAFT_490930 [Hypoxylon sp. NC1633]|nr:hypothetical protein GGR54DRAFT_490930 [Hypoxylon sp. NC1633]
MRVISDLTQPGSSRYLQPVHGGSYACNGKRLIGDGKSNEESFPISAHPTLAYWAVLLREVKTRAGDFSMAVSFGGWLSWLRGADLLMSKRDPAPLPPSLPPLNFFSPAWDALTRTPTLYLILSHSIQSAFRPAELIASNVRIHEHHQHSLGCLCNPCPPHSFINSKTSP